MRFGSLEEEFAYYAIEKNLYKCNKMLPKMIDYFESVEQNEINLSGIYQDSIESRAKREIIKVLFSDINRFDNLYEKVLI